MLQYNPNELVKEKAPKNVSKYPIEQTYVLDYNINNNNNNKNNNYSCKMPELWNSSISSKKTIAIREINMIPQQYNLRFRMYWKVELSDTKKYNGFIKYDNTISNEDKTGDVLSDVKTYIDNVFANYTENDGELVNTIRFLYYYDETDNTYSFGIHSSQIEKSYPHASISFKIVDFLYGDSTLGSESWNRLMNQPLEKHAIMQIYIHIKMYGIS